MSALESLRTIVFTFLALFSLTKFNLSAFVTTKKLERLIAAAANIGFNCHPRNFINTPAAKGIPITLYINAQNRFS